MIRIVRDRTAVPAAFQSTGRVKKEQTLLEAKRDHLQRQQTDPEAAHGFKSSWWKAAKDQLRKEARGKCAYCEARADAVAHCDVEHFRPKDTWWWLTCCWDNYLFACQICNQEYKSNHFPSAKSIPPVSLKHNTTDPALAAMSGKLAPDPVVPAEITAWLKVLAKEKADIIDPCLTDPEEFFAWEVDDDAGEITLVARTTTPKVKRIVKACVDIFGLNREELRQLRYETFEALDIARKALESPGLPEARRTKILRRLTRYASSARAFTGMSRYFLIDVWKLLPPAARV